jgi:hypothetical protein
VIKIRQLFLRPSACLTTLLETGVGANDCKCSRDQQLNLPSEARSLHIYTYTHTHHSRFIPERVAEVSQIFLRDTHVLLTLISYEERADVTGGKPIAVILQSISGVSCHTRPGPAKSRGCVIKQYKINC